MVCRCMIHLLTSHLFCDTITSENVQINCVSRDPLRPAEKASPSLTMHIVKFKAPPSKIPQKVAEIAQRNPADGAGYHSFLFRNTVVSFEPAIAQIIAELDTNKETTRYQYPCVAERSHLWNFCQRLVDQFNHAVDGFTWSPLRLSPYVESDGNNGLGVMANADATA